MLTDLPRVQHKSLLDGNDRIDRIATPIMDNKRNAVDVCYSVIVDNGTEPSIRFEEVHKMRYWFRPEIEYLLNQAGFDLIDNYSSTFGEAGYDSWTSYFIAKALYSSVWLTLSTY